MVKMHVGIMLMVDRDLEIIVYPIIAKLLMLCSMIDFEVQEARGNFIFKRIYREFTQTYTHLLQLTQKLTHDICMIFQ